MAFAASRSSFQTSGWPVAAESSARAERSSITRSSALHASASARPRRAVRRFTKSRLNVKITSSRAICEEMAPTSASTENSRARNDATVGATMISVSLSSSALGAEPPPSR